MNIGQEIDFYKLKELSKESIEFIRKLAIDPLPKPLQKLNKGWIDIFNLVFKIQEYTDKKGIKNQELDEMLDEYIHNLEEDLHTSIENSSVKFLEAILDENLSFYENDDDCMEFMHFICVQYMRTNNIKQKVIVATQQSKLIDIKDIWNVLTHIFATSMGWSLFSDRNSFRLVLLKNSTEVDFITGDQPIINTHVTRTKKFEPITELELYYPVSPKLAILMTKNDSLARGEKVELSVSEVEKYNDQIFKQSHSQIYAKSRSDLEKYLV